MAHGRKPREIDTHQRWVNDSDPALSLLFRFIFLCSIYVLNSIFHCTVLPDLVLFDKKTKSSCPIRLSGYAPLHGPPAPPVLFVFVRVPAEMVCSVLVVFGRVPAALSSPDHVQPTCPNSYFSAFSRRFWQQSLGEVASSLQASSMY